jgi:hypothetical protein
MSTRAAKHARVCVRAVPPPGAPAAHPAAGREAAPCVGWTDGDGGSRFPGPCRGKAGISPSRRTQGAVPKSQRRHRFHGRFCGTALRACLGGLTGASRCQRETLGSRHPHARPPAAQNAAGRRFCPTLGAATPRVAVLLSAAFAQKASLQGHSLMLFGPQNRLRKYMQAVIQNPVTDRLLVGMIFFNVFLLALQTPGS